MPGPKREPHHRDYEVKDHTHYWLFTHASCSHQKRWLDGHTSIKCKHCDARSLAEYGELGPCSCVTVS